MSITGETVTVKVCSLSELPDGSIKVFKVNGTEGVIIRNGENFHACERYCTHEKFPLEFGRLKDAHTLCCTYHGAEFDLITGEVKKLPAIKGITIYEVQIDGDDVLVNLPR